MTFRPTSMFAADIEANRNILTREIRGKKVCVIGGAGSIGSSFIKAVLRFEPASVVVYDRLELGEMGFEYTRIGEKSYCKLQGRRNPLVSHKD